MQVAQCRVEDAVTLTLILDNGKQVIRFNCVQIQSQILETTTPLIANCPDHYHLHLSDGMTSLVDRLTGLTPLRSGVRKRRFNSRGVSTGRIPGDSSRLLAARNDGDRVVESLTNASGDGWSLKGAESSIVRGVDLTKIQTRTKRNLLRIDRTDFSSSFNCGLQTCFEGIEITTTNEYWKCEEWCDLIRKQGTPVLGLSLYHAYLSEPPPQPDPGNRPRARYKKENSLKKPPPLPPGGPLILREGGPVIVMLTLAAEDRILLLQLRHMKVIGPNLRAILEDPFLCKCGRHLIEFRKVLRQDGLQLVGVHDIEQLFLRSIKGFSMKKKTKEILKQAGFHTFMKSITGVDLIEEEFPAFTWGEEEISDDQIEAAAREAWACWATVKILQELNPETVPLMSGITQKTV